MRIARHFAQGDPDRMRDALRGQAGGRGPASRPEQLGHAGIRPAFDQVPDAVAAVEETTVRAVDQAQGSRPSNDALETGVAPDYGHEGTTRHVALVTGQASCHPGTYAIPCASATA